MMAEALHLEFELIPAIPLLRGYLRVPDGPIYDVIEVTPTGKDDYGAFLGAVLGRTGKPELTISANYPVDLGRTTAPKTQIKRACQAAFDALQSAGSEGSRL